MRPNYIFMNEIWHQEHNNLDVVCLNFAIRVKKCQWEEGELVARTL